MLAWWRIEMLCVVAPAVAAGLFGFLRSGLSAAGLFFAARWLRVWDGCPCLPCLSFLVSVCSFAVGAV